MNTNPENPSNEIEANIQSGITRRTFIKRTTATVVVTALALHAFRNEVHAVESGSSSDVLISTTYCYNAGEGGFNSESAAKDGSRSAFNLEKNKIITQRRGPQGNKIIPTPSPLKVPDPFTPTVTYTSYTVDGVTKWMWQSTGTVIYYHYVDPPQ